ncbi:acyltransferase [Coleofasciculus sp. FACHB-1120]|uniref:acyltransferase family protein n=1 Tax=Coleofasciculus sp. FACHB-1120 TaxID=2692783 RepID=UPI001684F23A|nr:acyltransferase [Coleofasciculus sp. FACHB-1120]MBD2740002.1 acyltransferase [Coleofasciculus sp. FACHB-1120]
MKPVAVQISPTKPEQLSSSRLDWIDYAKGIGIILVVYVHVLTNLKNAGMGMHDLFHDFSFHFISSFHMPLFFFLSGLFVEKSLLKGKKKFWGDKFNTIVYPYLLWSVIQGSILVLMSNYTNNPIKLQLKDLPFYMAFNPIPLITLWFLYVLFASYVVFVFAQRFINIYILLSFSILIYLLNPYAPSEILTKFMSMFVFFVVGAIVARWLQNDLRNIPSTLYKLNKQQIGAITLIFVIFQMTILQLGLSEQPGTRFFMASGGIIFTLGISFYLAEIKKLDIIRYLGFLSMPIYLAHLLAMGSTRIFLQKGLHINHVVVHIIVVTFFSLLFPILLYELTKKIKFPYLFSLSKGSALSSAILADKSTQALQQ